MGGGDDTALTLKDVVTTAVNNNPTVTEAQQLWQAKAARIPAASAWANPKLAIMQDDIATHSINPFSAMMTQYTLSQEIMYPGKLSLMGKMAENDARMAEANYRDRRLAVYVDAKQAYYDLLYASKAVEIAQENLQFMKQLVQIAQVNYSTGMASIADVLKAETEYTKMDTELPSMAAMATVARARVNTVMGRGTDVPLNVKEEFLAPPPNFDLAALTKTAAAQKPALQGMQYQVNMAQSGLDLAKKQKLPDFEVSLSYKDYKETPDTWQVEVMAMLPVWQKKNRAEIDAAAGNLEAARSSLANMQNMTALDVQMALTEAQTAWRQIELYKNGIIPQAEQTYQAAVIGYTNGKVDFMTVLEDLTTLRNAKLTYYKTRVDYEKAVANLEKAVGKPLFGATDF